MKLKQYMTYIIYIYIIKWPILTINLKNVNYDINLPKVNTRLKTNNKFAFEDGSRLNITLRSELNQALIP